MTGIFAAQFGCVIAYLFNQEPAAGHVTMFARRGSFLVCDNICDIGCVP
jgi:hypothetical protein